MDNFEDDDVEMVEGARYNRNGVNRIFSKVDAEYMDPLDDDAQMHAKRNEEVAEKIEMRQAVRRQNSCWLLALSTILISLSIFYVDKFYMLPQEAISFETGETGEGGIDSGTLGNNVLNANAGKKQNKNNQHVGGGTAGSGGANQLSAQDWFKKQGKVSPLSKDDPRMANRTKGKIYMPIPNVGFPGKPLPKGKFFDRKSWFTSTVTLADGIMFDVKRQLAHDPTAFTEGLAFSNGVLWESTGLNGHSTIRTLDKVSGEVLQSFPLHSKYFGEGLTIYDGKAIQLTWQQKIGFIYDVNNLAKPPKNFTFDSTTGEGWGLTYDRLKDELIMSDGSEYLHFWDPETFQQRRKIKVRRQDGKTTKNINELEFFHGRILANIWYEDVIIVINPVNGVVEKEYDFSSLWPSTARAANKADVLNGISISDDPSMIYVTGKYWDRMFLVKLKF